MLNLKIYSLSCKSESHMPLILLHNEVIKRGFVGAMFLNGLNPFAK